MAQTLARLQAANADIASAIADKGVTVPSESGLEDYADLISTIDGGGGDTPPDPNKPVKIYDYDGTLYKSYTAAEFLELDGFPEPPDHFDDMMLLSHWYNWEFREAQEYVSRYGMLNCANMVEDAQSDFRIDVTLTNSTLHPQIELINVYVPDGDVTVVWGDGSSTIYNPPGGASMFNYDSLTIDHQYLRAGDYSIRISFGDPYSYREYGLNGMPAESCSVTKGNPWFVDGDETGSDQRSVRYSACVKRIFLGEHFSNDPNAIAPFMGLIRLETFCMLPRIEYGSFIQSTMIDFQAQCFYNCLGLKFIAFPPCVHTISWGQFDECRNLETVCLGGSMFYNGEVFDQEENPETGEIDYVGTGEQSITTMPVYINTSAFNKCASLKNFLIPDSTHSFDNEPELFGTGTIYKCFANTNALLSELTCSINTFIIPKWYGGENNFLDLLKYNEGLEHLIISEELMSGINQTFIDQCRNLKTIKFMATTPPTMTGSASTGYWPRDMKIYVPQASLAAYQAASNYPDPTVWEYIGY